MKTKFLLLCVALCVIAFESYSQTSKGGFLVGGSLGFSSSKTKYYYRNTAVIPEIKTVDIFFSPTVYYLFVDRLAVGLTLPLTYHRYKIDDYKSHRFGYGVGPALRYYFTFNKWAVFPTASYTFSYQTSTSDGRAQIVTSKHTNTIKTFKGGVGVVYFINSTIGIEGILSYQHQQTSYHYDVVDYLQLQKEEVPSINFNVGLQFYLSKRP